MHQLQPSPCFQLLGLFDRKFLSIPLRIDIDNDVYDFTPQAPMRLLHCNGDDNVTYQNAVVAYNSFIDSGAENVELIDGGNLNHEDCFGGAIIGAKLWIDSMADFCNTSISENGIKILGKLKKKKKLFY